MGSMLKLIFNLSSHPQLGRSENERESTDLIKSQVFPYFAPRRLENIFYVTESSQNNKKDFNFGASVMFEEGTSHKVRLSRGRNLSYTLLDIYASCLIHDFIHYSY